METYNQNFARFYNFAAGGFANSIVPKILEFYEGTSIGRTNNSILDLCCGTGQFSLHCLSRGYKVTGIDISASMLNYAIANTRTYFDVGQAKFIQDDATKFTLNERFGLVVATFDSLNHLENEVALKSCFERVFTVSEGYFIFDLNTRAGLQKWNGVQMIEDEDMVVIVDKNFDEGNRKAYAKFSCFIRNNESLYERAEETIFNTLYVMDNVRNALLEVGWKDVYFAKINNLNKAILQPEEERRIFVIAKKI